MGALLQLLLFGTGGVIIAVLSNIVLLKLSKSLGFHSKNDVVIRWNRESKPSLGGVSFFIVFVIASLLLSYVFSDESGGLFENIRFLGLFVAASIVFVMGITDDAYDTSPLFKLFAQVLCGILFVATGSNIELFHSFYPDAILTVIWVVVVMNSLNMLDNMDGITGTTVFFILLTCLISGWIRFGFSSDIWSLLNVSLIGAIVGFLTVNVNPSKIFMGDAGSQFIGLFVAYYGVEYLWNIGETYEQSSWLGASVVLVAFTPAAVDTLTVVINRLKKGKSPMVGGKDHTTHHLVYSGLTDRKVWYVFLLIGAFSSIFAVAMVNLIQLDLGLPIVLFISYFFFVFAILYRNTIKHTAPKNK